MKKLLLIAVAAFMMLPAISQQATSTNDNSPEVRAERRTARMERELQLTADQKTKVYTETLKLMKKSDEIKAKYKDGSNEASQNEVKVARQDYKKAMQGILTAEQFARFKEMDKGGKRPGTAGKK
jgi:Spy/CpxP family protein refolding chaperone